VRQLVVHLNKNAFILLPVLLEKWPHLISLSIFGDIPDDLDFQQDLCQVINAQSQLKRLEFFNELIFASDNVFHLAFPMPDVMAQLEVLSLIGCAGNILDILVLLGSCLKELTLDRISLEQLQALFDVKPNFADNLICLSVDDLDEGSLYFICAHFGSLQSLEIGLDVSVLVANSVYSLTPFRSKSTTLPITFVISQSCRS